MTRILARRLFSFLFLVPLSFASASAEAPAARPNILFILCDDLGYGDIGVFNQTARQARKEPAILTPNLDTMAAEGIALRGMYCPSPVCAPSRASLFTGVTQGHAAVRDNQFDKALEDNHTVATVLRQAGYHTALIGKWGLQGNGNSPETWPAYPTKRGFDDFFGYVRHGDGHEHYPKEGLHRGKKEVWDGTKEISADLDNCLTTDLFTARAKKWITDTRSSSPDKPFFLTLAFDAPHAVIELPTGPYPAGRGLHGGLQWTGESGEMINSAQGTPDSFIDPRYAEGRTGNRPWPDVYKRYATTVSRIDECVGDLLGLLKDLKIDANTLVVFTSDNGPSIESYLPEAYAPTFFGGFGPFDGIKRDVWEGGLRVGAISRFTGMIPANRSSDQPMQFHDWMTTFAELAGVPAPARADGVSLVPALTGKGTQKPSTLYSEYQVGGKTPGFQQFGPDHRGRVRNQMQFIRLDDFVGVRYDVKSHADPFEIYDVIKDPGQRNDLAKQKPDLQQAMHDAVLQRRMPNASAKRPYDAERVPPVYQTGAKPGVAVSTYDGEFPWLPRLEDLTATATASAPTTEEVSGKFAAVMISGYVSIPADGEYIFALNPVGKAFFRLHDAAVIDADYGHKPGERRQGTILLKPGMHPFRLDRGAGADGTMESSPLLWKTPDSADFVPVPAAVLFH